MYHIIRTKDFEKSYRRIKHSGKLSQQGEDNLREAIQILAKGGKMASSFKDHHLLGELKEFRECHIKGNLLLVYQIKMEELLLVLVEIGSHAFLDL